MFLKERILGAI